MEILNQCPLCKGVDFYHYKTLNDYFLSGETFHLMKCNNCGFVFTNPRPKTENMSKYYQSSKYLSHSKSQKNLTSFLYNVVKIYSLKTKYDIISQYYRKGKILDIGCGTGELLHYFKKKGWVTKGIEPATEARNFAIKKYDLDVSDEYELLNLNNQSYDVVTLWHVLEHIPGLSEQVGQIQYLLKKDGITVIALPNYLSWDAQHYDNFWAGYDVPRHLYHFSKNTISQLLSKHDMVIVKTIPMKFDSFYVSLLSEKYKTGKTNFISAFRNGIKSNLVASRNDNNYSSIIYIAKKRNE
jgi:2-polyprenyl-3-methyl-5-hydroxy-6-metoxy-1,4-benzoquinol methylase